MKVFNVEQGTQEWKALRMKHFCSSDAAAMMGDSKYKSRNELLEEKSTGLVKEVSQALQAVFDRGHETEARAREIIEFESLGDFPPVVGTASVQGLNLLASFDGLNDGDRTIFEHKQWNETLSRNVISGVLEPEHYWQLEHQLLVANGEADAVLFVVSDGTLKNRETMTYTSTSERRAKLIAGWKRFAEDLANWQPTAKQETVVGADAEGFPLVEYRVEGSLILSNIKDVLPIIKERAKEEMARALETDQDFADKENMNKAVKEARQRIKDAVETVKGEFVSYADFASTADQIDAVLQKLQSHGEKAVKDAKEQKKQAIAKDANANYLTYMNGINQQIPPLDSGRIVTIRPDFPGAMKNKRTLESLQGAVDDELNRFKIEVDQVVTIVKQNMDWFNNSLDVDYSFLFRDMESLVSQTHEGFKAIVQQRISDHERIERERREREEEARKKKDAEATEKIAEPIKQEPERKPQVLKAKPLTFHDEIEHWAVAFSVSSDAVSALFDLLAKHRAAA